MHQYQAMLKEFLMVRVHDFRSKLHISQESMAEILRIAPRSYVDLEHGKYGFSATTLVLFLLAHSDEEVLELLHDLRKIMERGHHDDVA